MLLLAGLRRPVFLCHLRADAPLIRRVDEPKASSAIYSKGRFRCGMADYASLNPPYDGYDGVSCRSHLKWRVVWRTV
jgi:hypothetical protein